MACSFNGRHPHHRHHNISDWHNPNYHCHTNFGSSQTYSRMCTTHEYTLYKLGLASSGSGYRWTWDQSRIKVVRTRKTVCSHYQSHCRNCRLSAHIYPNYCVVLDFLNISCHTNHACQLQGINDRYPSKSAQLIMILSGALSPTTAFRSGEISPTTNPTIYVYETSFKELSSVGNIF